MSIYPITVKKKSGRADSVSGGKDYHLVLITLADGRALFVTRFGKKSTWGSGLHVERYDNTAAAESAYRAKHREKLSKAYDEIIIDTKVVCADWSEFRRALGEQYWNKIGASNLEWILPGADTKGVREERQKEFVEDKDGKMRVKEEPKRLIPDVIESAEERVKHTPVWGLF